VYGPLCMNIDCLREEIVLPALKRGEHLVIQNVGAYSVTQWMQFISLRPKVVMTMEDGNVEIIRDSEELDYITSLEKLPEKLSSFNLT
jgi:diaminopimelate decarboxylase